MIRFFFAMSKQKISQKPGKTWLAAHPQQKSILVDQRLELFHIAGQQIPAMCMALSSPKIPKNKLVKHIYAEGLWRQVVCSLFAKGGYVSIILMPSCIHEHNVNIFPALALEHGLPMYVNTST